MLGCDLEFGECLFYGGGNYCGDCGFQAGLEAAGEGFEGLYSDVRAEAENLLEPSAARAKLNRPSFDTI